MKKYAKRTDYTVEFEVVEAGKKIYNFLEDSTAVTDEAHCVVLTGTAGERWVITMVQLLKNYDCSAFEGKNLKIGDRGYVNLRPDNNFIWAEPAKGPCIVKTSWGVELRATTGDFIVCADKDGAPDKEDRWVINKMIFPYTYEQVEGTDPDDDIKIFISKAKQNAYGSDSEYVEDKDGNKTLSYTDEDFPGMEYTDTYAGAEQFSGQEAVYVEDPTGRKKVFTMTYSGIEIKSFKEEPSIFDCLSKALIEGAKQHQLRGAKFTKEVDEEGNVKVNPITSKDGKYIYNVTYEWVGNEYMYGFETIIDTATLVEVFRCHFQATVLR